MRQGRPCPRCHLDSGTDCCRVLFRCMCQEILSTRPWLRLPLSSRLTFLKVGTYSGRKGLRERVNMVISAPFWSQSISLLDTPAHRDSGGIVSIAILRCRKITIAAVNGHAVSNIKFLSFNLSSYNIGWSWYDGSSITL